MVNKSDKASGSAGHEPAKDGEPALTRPALTREERLAAELRRNLLKRKAQSRNRSAVEAGRDGNDDGTGA